MRRGRPACPVVDIELATVARTPEPADILVVDVREKDAPAPASHPCVGPTSRAHPRVPEPEASPDIEGLEVADDPTDPPRKLGSVVPSQVSPKGRAAMKTAIR